MALLKHDSRASQIFQQFVRYGTSGTIATVADVGLLWVFTSLLGVHYLVSASLSYLTGFFISFELNRRWTFTRTEKTLRSLQRYTLIAMLKYAVTIILLYLFVDILQWHYLAAKAIVLALTFLWTFLLYRIYVYAT